MYKTRSTTQYVQSVLHKIHRRNAVVTYAEMQKYTMIKTSLKSEYVRGVSHCSELPDTKRLAHREMSYIVC